MKKRVRTFSQYFPSGHCREGKKTYFIEQIVNGFGLDPKSRYYRDMVLKLNAERIQQGKVSREDVIWFVDNLSAGIQQTKIHTIRSGHHFQVGDLIDFRVWSGRPYFSSQIIFWEPTEVKIVRDFRVKITKGFTSKNGHPTFHLSDVRLLPESIDTIAKGDGLITIDFESWFSKKFEGELICWKDPSEVYLLLN